MMVEGTARGGPRDGVKLTASPNWDGRVKVPGKEIEGRESHFYPGYYKWTGKDWLWLPVSGKVSKQRTKSKPRDPLADFNQVIPFRTTRKAP